MKRLVICCDGTWNTPDQKDGEASSPSNVVKMARAVRVVDDAGVHQIVYYSRGVGTRSGLDKWTGGAFGHGLATNVQDGYRFIVSNYQPGDEIFLFGFSRGAYTARSIVGFIRNSGLLRRENREMFPEAYELYRSRANHPDEQRASTFRKEYSHEVQVRFLGVWDTVGALGIPVRGLNWLTRKRYQFHDVQLSRIVDHACHALAIDEQRSQFRPALWETSAADASRVEQVWFSGVHTNVGGGYRDCGLSDLALDWMLTRAAEHGLGFDHSYMEEHIRPDAMCVLRESRKGFYRLSRPFVRPIGQLTAGESIHPSVMERHANPTMAYRPANLLDWMKRASTPA
ncbi:MAG: DUF2235 domain-containing protein [Bacteroidota bacterium]